MKTVSLVTAGSLIAVGAVVAPAFNFIPSHASVDVGENTIQATETAYGIRLEWELVDPEATIQILDDGEIVAEADSSGSTIDPGALAGIVEYQVVVEEPAEVSDFDEEIPEDVENFAHIVTVPLVIGDELALAANASGNTPVTTFRYQTFIGAAFVDAPIVVCGPTLESKFKGDGRGWGVSNPSFRTRFDVQIDWRENGFMKMSRSVGETQLWDYKNGVFQMIDAGTQAPNIMNVTVNYRSSSAASFSIYHDVKNPLCDSRVTNGIYYDIDVKVWRSGSYSATGVMRKAPHHEFYVKDSDESGWTAIWQKGYVGFDCFAITEYADSGCYAQSTNTGTRW